jgi:REP element-mobilizing transposase RayT
MLGWLWASNSRFDLSDCGIAQCVSLGNASKASTMIWSLVKRRVIRKSNRGQTTVFDVLSDGENRGLSPIDYMSAIHIARTYGERKRKFVGQHFWARGYFVSAVGRDEEVIREYIRHQKVEDKRIDQLDFPR